MERVDVVVEVERSERELEKIVLVGLEEREPTGEGPRLESEILRTCDVSGALLYRSADGDAARE